MDFDKFLDGTLSGVKDKADKKLIKVKEENQLLKIKLVSQENELEELRRQLTAIAFDYQRRTRDAPPRELSQAILFDQVVRTLRSIVPKNLLGSGGHLAEEFSNILNSAQRGKVTTFQQLVPRLKRFIRKMFREAMRFSNSLAMESTLRLSILLNLTEPYFELNQLNSDFDQELNNDLEKLMSFKIKLKKIGSGYDKVRVDTAQTAADSQQTELNDQLKDLIRVILERDFAMVLAGDDNGGTKRKDLAKKEIRQVFNTISDRVVNHQYISLEQFETELIYLISLIKGKLKKNTSLVDFMLSLLTTVKIDDSTLQTVKTDCKRPSNGGTVVTKHIQGDNQTASNQVMKLTDTISGNDFLAAGPSTSSMAQTLNTSDRSEEEMKKRTKKQITFLSNQLSSCRVELEKTNSLEISNTEPSRSNSTQIDLECSEDIGSEELSQSADAVNPVESGLNRFLLKVLAALEQRPSGELLSTNACYSNTKPQQMKAMKTIREQYQSIRLQITKEYYKDYVGFKRDVDKLITLLIAFSKKYNCQEARSAADSLEYMQQSILRELNENENLILELEDNTFDSNYEFEFITTSVGINEDDGLPETPIDPQNCNDILKLLLKERTILDQPGKVRGVTRLRTSDIMCNQMKYKFMSLRRNVELNRIRSFRQFDQELKELHSMLNSYDKCVRKEERYDLATEFGDQNDRDAWTLNSEVVVVHQAGGSIPKTREPLKQRIAVGVTGTRLEAGISVTDIKWADIRAACPLPTAPAGSFRRPKKPVAKKIKISASKRSGSCV